jgi:hypothetical protein
MSDELRLLGCAISFSLSLHCRLRIYLWIPGNTGGSLKRQSTIGNQQWIDKLKLIGHVAYGFGGSGRDNDAAIYSVNPASDPSCRNL